MNSRIALAFDGEGLSVGYARRDGECDCTVFTHHAFPVTIAALISYDFAFAFTLGTFHRRLRQPEEGLLLAQYTA